MNKKQYKLALKTLKKLKKLCDSYEEESIESCMLNFEGLRLKTIIMQIVSGELSKKYEEWENREKEEEEEETHEYDA